MIQSRRVFSLTNSIVNYLFLVFLLLCGVYFISFWMELRQSFLDTVLNIVNVSAWIVTGLSLILAGISVWISVSDKEFQTGKLVWSIARMAICIILAVFVDVCAILVAGNVSVNL